MASLGSGRPLPVAFKLAMAAAVVLAILQIGSISVCMADVTRTRFSAAYFSTG